MTAAGPLDGFRVVEDAEDARGLGAYAGLFVDERAAAGRREVRIAAADGRDAQQCVGRIASRPRVRIVLEQVNRLSARSLRELEDSDPEECLLHNARIRIAQGAEQRTEYRRIAGESERDR